MLFKLPAQQLMAVTHNLCPKQFKRYVVNRASNDPEAAAHTARTFSLWAQNHYQPPATTSIPDALGRINTANRSAFGDLNNTQRCINTNCVDPQRAPDHPQPLPAEARRRLS